MTAAPAPFHPEIAHTRLGPIEYATVGQGQPVLVVHGTPGGIDAADMMARFLPRDQFRAILLSRPGYLGTELGDRRTVDAQADLYAALLDELGIDRAAVLAWSGGGPSAYRFAARHPERISALVAHACVSQRYELPQQDLSSRLMFATSIGEWLLRMLIAHAPTQVIAGTLSSEGNLTKDQLAERVAEVFADDAKREFVLGMAPTASQRGQRKAGLDNDLEQFATITTLGLETITAPCLVVQGTVDTDLPPAQSYHAAETIPNAELVTLATGTHFALYTHPDAGTVQTRVIEFLRG